MYKTNMKMNGEIKYKFFKGKCPNNHYHEEFIPEEGVEFILCDYCEYPVRELEEFIGVPIDVEMEEKLNIIDLDEGCVKEETKEIEYSDVIEEERINKVQTSTRENEIPIFCGGKEISEDISISDTCKIPYAESNGGMVWYPTRIAKPIAFHYVLALSTEGGGKVHIAKWNGQKWTSYDDDEYDLEFVNWKTKTQYKVTHWCYVPKLPK